MKITLHYVALLLFTYTVSTFATTECVENGVEECGSKPVQKKSKVEKYSIQHSLGPANTFVNRGELEVSTSKKTKKISIKFSSKSYEFSDEERERFNEVVEKNAFYRIRVPVNPSDTDGPWLYASVRGCLLLANEFKESFRFHLDKSGKINSVELQPLGDISACSVDSVVPKKVLVRSKASASLPREAHIAKPEILAQSNLKKSNLPSELQQDLGKGGLSSKGTSEDGKQGEDEAPASFIRKYWYIFVPLFLASMFGGGQQAPEGKK